MEKDSRKMRKDRPFTFTNLKSGEGVDVVVATIERLGGLGRAGDS